MIIGRGGAGATEKNSLAAATGAGLSDGRRSGRNMGALSWADAWLADPRKVNFVNPEIPAPGPSTPAGADKPAFFAPRRPDERRQNYFYDLRKIDLQNKNHGLYYHCCHAQWPRLFFVSRHFF